MIDFNPKLIHGNGQGNDKECRLSLLPLLKFCIACRIAYAIQEKKIICPYPFTCLCVCSFTNKILNRHEKERLPVNSIFRPFNSIFFISPCTQVLGILNGILHAGQSITNRTQNRTKGQDRTIQESTSMTMEVVQ